MLLYFRKPRFPPLYAERLCQSHALGIPGSAFSTIIPRALLHDLFWGRKIWERSFLWFIHSHYGLFSIMDDVEVVPPVTKTRVISGSGEAPFVIISVDRDFVKIEITGLTVDSYLLLRRITAVAINSNGFSNKYIMSATVLKRINEATNGPIKL